MLKVIPLPFLSPVSRLAAMDQAIHRLNVGHYTLDVKMSQLLDKVNRLDGRIGDIVDTVQQVSLLSKENRKEVGRVEGKECQFWIHFLG